MKGSVLHRHLYFEIPKKETAKNEACTRHAKFACRGFIRAFSLHGGRSLFVLLGFREAQEDPFARATKCNRSGVLSQM